jgi:hypothetical protein
MIFQLASSVVDPRTLSTARLRTGSQTPKAADSATFMSAAFTQWRRGQRRTCPRVTGAISRNAITVGVERTGYAEPDGVVRVSGSAAGGVDSAIMQKGQGIFKTFKRNEDILGGLGFMKS